MADQLGPALRIYDGEQFRHLLAWEVQRATRYQDFLTLCLARATHGGALSPELLDSIARRAAELLRSTDVVGVMDDAIGIILVHTPDNDAATIIDRLQGRLEAETFQATLGTPGVTPLLSLGLASFPNDATADGTLVAHAQARLDEARGSGGRSSQAS